VGAINFDFFLYASTISTSFTESTGKAVIKGGKGCFASIAGAATRVQVGTTLPRVFEWTFFALMLPPSASFNKFSMLFCCCFLRHNIAPLSVFIFSPHETAVFSKRHRFPFQKIRSNFDASAN
jgi:hypothetical protein